MKERTTPNDMVTLWQLYNINNMLEMRMIRNKCLQRNEVSDFGLTTNLYMHSNKQNIIILKSHAKIKQ